MRTTQKRERKSQDFFYRENLEIYGILGRKVNIEKWKS